MEGSANAHSGRELSATDLAYDILKSHGQAMYYKDLINEILGLQVYGGENVARLIAQIHTEINLDSRFQHKGGGQWGLREWTFKGGRVVNIKPERAQPKKQVNPLRLYEEDNEGEEAFEANGEEREEDVDFSSEALEESPEDDWE